MAILSIAELAHYRNMTVSRTLTDEITDPLIQAYYEQALAFAEDDDITEARTAVYILRDVIGIFAEKTNLNGQIENEQRSQLFDHAEKLLKKYEGLAGMQTLGRLSTGVLGLGIDTVEETA